MGESLSQRRNQAFAQRRGHAGQAFLLGLIAATAIGRLDADGRASPLGQVVRTGAHVQISQLHGQLEAVQEKFRAAPRHRLRRPFVEIHVGVDATGLFQHYSAFQRRLQAIQGFRRRGEKPERIVV